MENLIQEYYNLIPLFIIAAGVVVSIIIELYFKDAERILPWFTVLLFLASGLHSLANTERISTEFSGMLLVGGNVALFYFIFTFGSAIVSLIAIDYLKKYGTNYGEFYILLQLSVLGMMLMAGAKDFIVIFLGLELMSISFYILAGLNRKNLFANEAALKYFLLGAFATGFTLYGIALLYGSVGSTNIEQISTKFLENSTNYLFIAGILLFLIGFSFKIAAFPFHMWVPDVYEGSSTAVTGLFSTAGKAAAFSSILITLGVIFRSGISNFFLPYLAVISILSMFYGGIVAIAQSNVKRMLAYSSIAHAGYMIIGLAAGNNAGYTGIIFYVIVYTFMNLGAFGIISIIEGEGDSNLSLKHYAGLSNKKPMLAALMAIFMFSLAGVPPFAGFFGKYYIFIAAVNANLTWLAILGVLASVISAYFYLRIVVLMYFKNSEEDFSVTVPNVSLFAVFISVLLVIILGIIPGSLIDLISGFVL